MDPPPREGELPPVLGGPWLGPAETVFVPKVDPNPPNDGAGDKVPEPDPNWKARAEGCVCVVFPPPPAAEPETALPPGAPKVNLGAACELPKLKVGACGGAGPTPAPGVGPAPSAGLPDEDADAVGAPNENEGAEGGLADPADAGAGASAPLPAELALEAPPVVDPKSNPLPAPKPDPLLVPLLKGGVEPMLKGAVVVPMEGPAEVVAGAPAAEAGVPNLNVPLGGAGPPKLNVGLLVGTAVAPGCCVPEVAGAPKAGRLAPGAEVDGVWPPSFELEG